jgi:hypothetical protein
MLDALTDVNKLFDRIKELGQTAVAITLIPMRNLVALSVKVRLKEESI